MTLKRIGVLSAGKVMAVIHAIFGLLIGIPFTLFALLGAAFGSFGEGGATGAVLGVVFGIGAFIALPIFYGIAGFVGGVLTAFVYNVAAGVLGGLEVELE